MPFENTDENIPFDQNNPLDQVVIPLLAEEVSVGKRQVATGRVKVSTVTHSREEQIEQLLESDRVEVDACRWDKWCHGSLRFVRRAIPPSFPW